MEVFALLGARVCSLGRERRSKWTQSKFISMDGAGESSYVLQSLCNNCGLAYERDKRLPPWAKNLHYADIPVGR